VRGGDGIRGEMRWGLGVRVRKNYEEFVFDIVLISF
jgi:hypothetical protein